MFRFSAKLILFFSFIKKSNRKCVNFILFYYLCHLNLLMTVVMKKYILSIIFAAVAFMASAQVSSVGIKGGLGVSSASGLVPIDDAPATRNNSIKSGLHLGVFANFGFGSFELEPSLIYMRQGYKTNVYDTNNVPANIDPNWIITSHYLSIPFDMKFYVLRGFYIDAGPQLSFLLSRNDNLKEDSECAEPFIGKGNKSVDFSVFFGMGYRFTENMFVEGRYCHGLIETSKFYKGGMNRNFMVSLGYRFNLDKKTLVKTKNQLLHRK